MPRHDFSPRPPRPDVGGQSFAPGFAYLAWVDRLARKRRKPGRNLDDGGVPVEPPRPKNLSGGAAAEPDFEDD